MHVSQILHFREDWRSSDGHWFQMLDLRLWQESQRGGTEMSEVEHAHKALSDQKGGFLVNTLP